MKKENKFLNILGKTLVYMMAILVALPFIWMLSTALKSRQEVLSGSFSLIPKHIAWDNFKVALSAGNFPRMFLNSFIQSFSVTFFQIITSALAGYAFARMKFKGRNFLFSVLLATLVIPFQMIVIPIYLMFSKINVLDTYWALILPNMANAFGIFLFRQFFASIPVSLEEAASIDGANRWTILWKIMFPLARPATVTLFMLTFIAEWNDLFKPLIFTSSEKMRTVQFGLTFFQEQYSTDYTLLMAAALVITVPVVILFLLGQRKFIEGIASSGMK